MKTIESQTGWKRPFPKTILQDVDVLLKIHEYSYDLNRVGFHGYFISRTGRGLTVREKWLCSIPIESAERYILTSGGMKYETGDIIPLEERPDYVTSHKILRAQLQDCWELYSQQ